MTFEEYVFNKISLKLNFWYSRGKEKSGIVNVNIVNTFTNKVQDFGIYYIITKMSFPVDIEMCDNPPIGSMVIEFTPDEFRNKQLVSILK